MPIHEPDKRIYFFTNAFSEDKGHESEKKIAAAHFGGLG